MYRIAKTLNHNSFIGVEEENNREYLVMGKGIAFGKKTGQRVQPGDDARIYSLTEMTERGNARTIVQGVSPLSLELASAVLDEAEKEFGKIDRSIVFPMADHLDFAVRRIQNGEQISNPLTDDIRVMFYKEYKVASCIRELLKERLQIEIDEHEIGYLALHVHSAIVEENVSQAMEVARAVRESISLVEHITGHTIDVMSLSYNRMMNHIKYMVARVSTGETLKLDMNELVDVYNGGRPIKVVANLPYYITTPIIMGLFESGVPIDNITVMVQKEVADRMQVGPGSKDYGALSLAVQYYAEPYIVANVPPNCFIPRPNVGSAVIRLTRHQTPPVEVKDRELMFKLIRASFNQRRKTLLNGLNNSPELSFGKEQIAAAIEQLGVPAAVRGEALTLEQFARLSDLLGESR